MDDKDIIIISSIAGGIIFVIFAHYLGKYYERKNWNKLIEDGILPTPTKEGQEIAFIINPNDKFFPAHNNIIWDYCVFLGKYTDKNGKKWDLGICIDDDGEIFDASVFSNVPHDYKSGKVIFDEESDDIDQMRELKRRAKIMNLLTDKNKG